MKKINPIIACLVVLAYSFSLTGCEDDNKEALQEALREAKEARNEAAGVKKALSKAGAEIDDLNEELYAAKNTRDKLNHQVQLLTAERDKAAAQTLQHQEAMRGTANTTNVENPVITTLQAEIAQLNKLVAEQQTIIAEQDAAIEELSESIRKAEGMAEVVEKPEMVEPDEPSEPNETL